ncbi:DNA translocase FtsK [Virgibacillus natechei]|nr:DNA translocase FtsK [Virgibacillus natechei]UZD14927.1 DNA translocase FtsK [Virgibacillus natechei]
MMYKYPDQTSFRFPVIPDTDNEKSKPLDTPAFERKKMNQIERENQPNQSNEAAEQPNFNKKIYKKNEDVPFVPTEVPSPVYGYQPTGKAEKQIENVPAFQRKKEKVEEEKSSSSVLEEQEELEEQSSSSVLEEQEEQSSSEVIEEQEELEEQSRSEVIEEQEELEEQSRSEVIEEQEELEEQSRSEVIEEQEELEEQSRSEVIEEQEEPEEESPSEVIDEQEDPEEQSPSEVIDEQEELEEQSRSEVIGEQEELAEQSRSEVIDEQGEPGEESRSEVCEEQEETELQPERDSKEVDSRHLASELLHREVASTQEVESHDKQRTSESQDGAIHTKKRKNADSYKRKVNKHEQENKRKQIPYNVIMTPRDKKNRMEKAKAAAKLAPQPTMESQPKGMPYHLLDDAEQKSNEDHKWVEDQQELLEQTLKHFNVRAKVVNATQGPSVTRFEVQPELGVKVSKVKNLSDDLKLNMSARDIRIEAPIPGKNTIGIEIPNPKAQMVGLQGIFETESFQASQSPLTIALGLTIEGSPLITNIQKMPHGLIAGATGSGKSVCINTILISLMYKANHKDVRFLLIDPKMVELAPYNGIPHLVSPVITDVKAATAALKWAVREMEGRYEKFVQEGVRDVERFNQQVIKQGRADEKMPFIVIVIDELADLMMVSPQDVEDAISRIAQKARACGIHLLVATQRPSVDVITGLIKANIPTRIAFSVSSQVDSRTMIDTSGAEKLLGKGDMLFVENGAGKSLRLQGPFVSDEEIDRVTNYSRNIASPNYLFEQDQLLEQITMDEEEDALLQESIQFVLKQNSASTSLLQRHFKIGYNRAARLIDTLENRGIISGQNGSKAREILVSNTNVEER